MPPFEQFVSSFLTATNENTAALVSAKVDFTLFKIEASPEYSAVGPALSASRRLDAEKGPIHRTARRLGALFEQLIPSTPKLIAAYGTRVSAIITRPDVNPSGRDEHGPFQPFVGADGTAMWAAATSGPGAMGVYLLALFLARLWDAKHAVSIWVDLIAGRRKDIREGLATGRNIPESTVMSTLQEISRHDLAAWDASARAWLRTAEQAKKIEWQLTQLHLVTKDLGLRFAGGSNTYEKVVSSWTMAMQGLEDFLDGRPQQITDAAILAAFSSWHLFPDLMVLTDSVIKVDLRDELFAKSAVGTIGLRSRVPEMDGGIRWSLTLSHLHHYGPPTEVLTIASSPKVTFKKLRIITLGILFSRWNVNHRHYLDAAQFICTLWRALYSAANKLEDSPTVEHQFSWFYTFVKASEDLVAAKDGEIAVLDDYLRLLAFGTRRNETFLGPVAEHMPPFFGLLSRSVLTALSASDDVDAAITFLRCIAANSGLTSQDGMVVYQHAPARNVVRSDSKFREYASLWHPGQMAKKRKLATGQSHSVGVAHWFLVPDKLKDPVDELLRERKLKVTKSGAQHMQVSSHLAIEAKNEEVHWYQAPRIFTSSSHTDAETLDSEAFHSCAGGECAPWMTAGANNASFVLVEGSLNCGLVLQNTSQLRCDDDCDLQAATKLIENSMNPELFYRFICLLAQQTWSFCDDDSGRPAWQASDNAGVDLVVQRFAIARQTCRALHALAFADRIFASIDTPTISLECLELGLHEVPWLSRFQPSSNNPGQYAPIPITPSRSEAFSCICSLDSAISLDPEQLANVIAMCCDNSIYVAAIALTDPANRPPDHEVRRITGNIGKAGISLLVAPQEPMIRARSNDYRAVSHRSYDFKRKDSFADTTLHLSFTDWTVPIVDPEVVRTVDSEVNLVETVLSVQESGRWVADLDILSINFDKLTILNECEISTNCVCAKHDVEEWSHNYDLKCIDSWDELLDKPGTTCIIRAHNNWAARLAATSILCQTGNIHAMCVLPLAKICLRCWTRDREAAIGRAGLAAYDTSLPYYCVD